MKWDVVLVQVASMRTNGFELRWKRARYVRPGLAAVAVAVRGEGPQEAAGANHAGQHQAHHQGLYTRPLFGST